MNWDCPVGFRTSKTIKTLLNSKGFGKSWILSYNCPPQTIAPQPHCRNWELIRLNYLFCVFLFTPEELSRDNSHSSWLLKSWCKSSLPWEEVWTGYGDNIFWDLQISLDKSEDLQKSWSRRQEISRNQERVRCGLLRYSIESHIKCVNYNYAHALL